MRRTAIGWALVGLAAMMLACNLARATPTATPAPTLAATATMVPNLVPSITPIGAATTTPLAETPTICIPPGWFQYIVQAGDTLTDIATRVGSTVQELVLRNCLASADAIFVGQTLYVPIQLPPTG